jgi:hypothetical protein
VRVVEPACHSQVFCDLSRKFLPVLDLLENVMLSILEKRFGSNRKEHK